MSGQLPAWFEIGSLVVITTILVADLIIIGRRPHVPSFAECARWVGFYVALALVFAGVLALVGGSAPATEFLAGWLTEYSLSLDNLFVFALILTSFAVPPRLQARALMAGILIALVLRAVLIVVGAAVLERFTWVFCIFGVILIATAVGMVREKEESTEYQENIVVRVVRRLLPVSLDYDGTRLTTRVPVRGAAAAGGPGAAGAVPTRVKRVLTPMALVIVALGTTDLLFALDSIPAIFGITADPFIVFTTNLFALMGLRQLYFMLSGLMERLRYLRYGLAVILGFIGVKLILHAAHTNRLWFVNGGNPIEWGPEISTVASLVVILGALVVAALASLLVRPRGARSGANNPASPASPDNPEAPDDPDSSTHDVGR